LDIGDHGRLNSDGHVFHGDPRAPVNPKKNMSGSTIFMAFSWLFGATW
jgi:hypothetical protein